ncbi:MAG: hypothetical protein ACREL6_01390, partial [Gemmatimonadales bacterium]
MTRALSLFLATTFVILSVALFPGLHFLNMIQNPERVARELDPWMIYALGIPAVAIEVEKDSRIQAIKGTLLHTTRGDLVRLLESHFTVEDVRRKAIEVHHNIVNDARRLPGDSLIFFVSVAEEKKVLLPAMHEFFERKIERRDGCSVGSVLDIAWMGVKDVFGEDKTDMEALHELPRCDPPDAVKNQVMNAVDARVAKLTRTGSDSVRASPDMSLKAHRRIKTALKAGEYYLLLVPVLLALLTGIAVANRRDRSVLWLRLGAPLLISGLSVLAVALPFTWSVQDLDVAGMVYRVEDPPVTASTGQWLNLV